MTKSDGSNDPSTKFGPFGFDAYEPDQVAERVLKIGVKKTLFPAYKTFLLGLMGGGFISFGAMYELFILSHPDIGDGTSAVISPFFYAMGYIIAFMSGAEIFTTNNLSAMALASGKLTFGEIAKKWSIVLVANLFGAFSIVVLFYFSGVAIIFDGALIDAAKISTANKIAYTPLQSVIIGIFGNMLICSGLWMAMAGRSVIDRFFVLILPLAAVPAMNFQHNTGNMFPFFLSLMPGSMNPDLAAEITILAISSNLFFVSVGNIIGGGILISVMYYYIYIKHSTTP
jgi:formate transporter